MEPDAPIQVFTLSRFRVLKDGASLSGNGDAQKRPFDLLKVLIALGGESIPEEQVCEALWPDSEGDAAKSTLGATLSRLRKAVGPDAIRLRQGRISLDTRHVWVDSLAFGEAAEAVSRALERGLLDAAHEAMHAALSLYRGPFLEGEFDLQPTLAARERLHHQFIRAVTRLGEALHGSGRDADATHLFQAGLTADPVSEELAQHLMRSLRRQGRMAEALTVYQRFREALRGALAVAPSAETDALYREILAAAPADPSTSAIPAHPASAPAAPAPDLEGPSSPPGSLSPGIAAVFRLSGRTWLALAALALVSVAITAWALMHSSAPSDPSALPLPDKPSIAVMPFENLSGDPAQEYFSDGITETLITDLSRLSGLFVIARDSTFSYKGRNVDVRQVGRDLGVKYVLEGSVQRSGDRVRINTQLIEARSNAHLWAERFDQDFKDIFAVQEEIRRRIVARLDLSVGGIEAGIWRQGTSNPEAYDLFLQAQEAFYRVTEEGVAKGVELYLKAIKLDPNFALAGVMLGFAYQTQGYSGWARPKEDSIKLAREMAEKALKIEPGLAEAYTLLGQLHYLYFNKHEEGLRLAEKGARLNPNSALSAIFHADALNSVGRYVDSSAVVERTLRLNPFPADWYMTIIGDSYLFSGAYEKAVATLERCTRRLPDFLWCHNGLAIAYAQTGRLENAKAAVKQALRINPEFTVESAIQATKAGAERDKIRAALLQAGLPDKPSKLQLPDKPSIAVMPFENLSGDPAQEYFSDGITETLITDLSRLSGLFVIARDSTFSYKGKTVDVRQVGRELGVRYVLEGSVQRSGDRVRINTQLIDAQTNAHLWAERFDQPFGDIFAIQDEIKRRIVARLDVGVGGEEAGVWRRATSNPQAYDLFLRAQEAFYQVTESGVARGEELYKRAIATDPKFALAHAMLGFVYQTQAYSGWARPREDSIRLATEAGRKAIELDESSVEAHTLLGVIYYAYQGKQDEGLKYTSRAVSLNPNSAFAAVFYGDNLALVGRFSDSLQMAERAMRLNPFPPDWYLLMISHAYLNADQIEKAIQIAERCTQRLPDFLWCHAVLAESYAAADRVHEARLQAQEVLRINPSFSLETALKPAKEGPVRDTKRKRYLLAGIPERAAGLK